MPGKVPRGPQSDRAEKLLNQLDPIKVAYSPPTMPAASGHWVSPYWEIAGYTKQENIPKDLFNPEDQKDYRDNFECLFRIYVLNLNPKPVNVLIVFQNMRGQRVGELTKEIKIPARTNWEYAPKITGLRALGWVSVSTKGQQPIFVAGYIKERNILPGGFKGEVSSASVVTYPMFFYPIPPELDERFER